MGADLYLLERELRASGKMIDPDDFGHDVNVAEYSIHEWLKSDQAQEFFSDYLGWYDGYDNWHENFDGEGHNMYQVSAENMLAAVAKKYKEASETLKGRKKK